MTFQAVIVQTCKQYILKSQVEKQHHLDMVATTKHKPKAVCGVFIQISCKIFTVNEMFFLLPRIYVYIFPVAFAGLNIWPSFHIALSNASVFVDFSTESNTSTIRNISLSLVNMETNTTLVTRTVPNNQLSGRVEFSCSCFLYAGTFRFLLRQTSTAAVSRANGTDKSGVERTSSWWSSELQVQWPTFHIAVERAGNHSGSFQARQIRSHTPASRHKMTLLIFIFVVIVVFCLSPGWDFH